MERGASIPSGGFCCIADLKIRWQNLLTGKREGHVCFCCFAGICMLIYIYLHEMSQKSLLCYKFIGTNCNSSKWEILYVSLMCIVSGHHCHRWWGEGWERSLMHPPFWAALKCILKLGFLAYPFVSFSSSLLFWVLFNIPVSYSSVILIRDTGTRYLFLCIARCPWGKHLITALRLCSPETNLWNAHMPANWTKLLRKITQTSTCYSDRVCFLLPTHPSHLNRNLLSWELQKSAFLFTFLSDSNVCCNESDCCPHASSPCKLCRSVVCDARAA